jgi:predicted kinase
MIKLLELLKEISQNKMVVMAGGAGAGKSYLLNKVKSKLPDVKILNPDTYVEDKNSPMYNSLTKASSQIDDVDVPNAISNGESFIWDTTASNAAKMLGGEYRRKQVKGILNTDGYDEMMVMVYTHPIVSFLRNFKRERKVPTVGVLSTWNSVYGNIEAYKNKLGDNFILYQAPDKEFQKQIDEFNDAVKSGKLKEYFENMLSSGEFKSTFRKDKVEPQTPEEIEKAEKAKVQSKALVDAQIDKLQKDFINIENKVKDSIITDENEVINRIVNFIK